MDFGHLHGHWREWSVAARGAFGQQPGFERRHVPGNEVGRRPAKAPFRHFNSTVLPCPHVKATEPFLVQRTKERGREPRFGINIPKGVFLHGNERLVLGYVDPAFAGQATEVPEHAASGSGFVFGLRTVSGGISSDLGHMVSARRPGPRCDRHKSAPPGIAEQALISPLRLRRPGAWDLRSNVIVNNATNEIDSDIGDG